MRDKVTDNCRIISHQNIRVLEEDGYNLIELIYARAHQKFSHGKIDQAEQLFRVLSSVDGEKIDHWLGLGICLRARNDHKNAMNAFDAAIKLDPQSPIPHLHRLELFIQEKEWNSAQASLDQFDRLVVHGIHDKLIAATRLFRKALSLRKK